MFMVVMALIVVAIPGLLIFALVRQHLRTRRALNQPITGDQCVGCGSTDVKTINREAYLCNGCGFTWGDGMAEYLAAQRRAEIDKLGLQERRALGVSELREADQRVASALATLEQGAHQVGWDVVAGGGFGTGDMYSRTRNESVVLAAGDLGKAQKHIRTAAEALQWHIDGADGRIDFHEAVFGLDVAFGSWAVDVAGHMQLDNLRKQAHQMQAAVRRALQDLAAPTA